MKYLAFILTLCVCLADNFNSVTVTKETVFDLKVVEYDTAIPVVWGLVEADSNDYEWEECLRASYFFLNDVSFDDWYSTHSSSIFSSEDEALERYNKIGLMFKDVEKFKLDQENIKRASILVLGEVWIRIGGGVYCSLPYVSNDGENIKGVSKLFVLEGGKLKKAGKLDYEKCSELPGFGKLMIASIEEMKPIYESSKARVNAEGVIVK